MKTLRKFVDSSSAYCPDDRRVQDDACLHAEERGVEGQRAQPRQAEEGPARRVRGDALQDGGGRARQGGYLISNLCFRAVKLSPCLHPGVVGDLHLPGRHPHRPEGAGGGQEVGHRPHHRAVQAGTVQYSAVQYSTEQYKQAVLAGAESHGQKYTDTCKADLERISDWWVGLK